ncbi:aminotransferase class V-fold PLP-dependent enzyme [Pseudomonas graminis]|uniref:aminotransferase class V-fold PLP-dependent enzyme n=1 Tax=Pseudomonas graminis TaxID=158627 RepID=UPI00234B8C2D|nr:aminotransferase class V-fold PLP-dependent enzyme [Pseudomonas graminis]MDC6379893.1 aminotransferase class V-fold PLP-dependent enzyme [Pseudomonas graminis]
MYDHDQLDAHGPLKAPPSRATGSMAAPQDFPVLRNKIDEKRIIYLDSAATSLKPSVVLDEMCRYYSDIGATIHRGKNYLADQASSDFEYVRAAVAQLCGFASNEVIFTANATASLNMVASGLMLQATDLVLLPFDAHHSAILPWRNFAKTLTIPTDFLGAIDLCAYKELLALKPSVVVLNGCSNVTGYYPPVAEMAQLAKSVGALTVMDGAQFIPHKQQSIPDIDFLAFSAHKMLGPSGLGVLCGRYDALLRLAPQSLGGGVVDWVDADNHILRRPPHRFEAGTPNIGGVYGFGAALSYLSNISFSHIEKHDLYLGEYLCHKVEERRFLDLLGSGSAYPRGALASFSVGSIHNLNELSRVLSDSYGIYCRTGHLCAQPFIDSITDNEVLRVSAYIYNDVQDIDDFFMALDEVYEFFKKG